MTDPKNQTNTDATAELPPVDDYANASEALREKLTDAQTPAYQAEFDPDEAERVGAFVEDAAASGDDLVEVDDALEPAFLDDEGPSADIPPFITTTNARELYDLRPGETVAQAAAQGVGGLTHADHESRGARGDAGFRPRLPRRARAGLQVPRGCGRTVRAACGRGAARHEGRLRAQGDDARRPRLPWPRGRALAERRERRRPA